MADKNFARSGTADTDLLADDDPLSELARLVNYEPRPVQSVDQTFTEGVQAAPRHENPVLALEDELLRAFEQYDAPAGYVAVEPVVAERAAPQQHVEPVFEAAAPVAEHFAARLDEAPTRDVAAGGFQHREPVFTDPVEPQTAFDPSLLLADELETSISDMPPVEAEPATHAGHAFADRFEPRFEEPVRQVIPVEPSFAEPAGAAEPQPAFIGFQPLAADDGLSDRIGLDLERELELSIGDGFADEMTADMSLVEPVTVAATADIAPDFDGWLPADAGVEHAEPFQAEPAAYAEEEPRFVAQMPSGALPEHARAEAEAAWQADADEPVFAPEPVYQVETVEAGRNYDNDALLAEVESFPVPESRSPFAAATVAAVAASATRSNTPANVSAIIGRATPTAYREPVAEKVEIPAVEPVPAAAVETRHDPVVPSVSEPELDFENMEFDLSDIEFDLSDFSLDEEIVKDEAKPVAVAQPAVAETPAWREPAVAVPVSAYTQPQPVAVDANDGALPFDPAMIAETDAGVSPVTELDVPQLPVIEKETPPVYQPDYDLDIDAEMAQLFSEPATRPRAEEAPVSAAAQPAAQISDVDDFERALEEDFRRSLQQPERMAIPVDPGQANVLYAGDGYDDEEARPRRGLLIAASIAGLLLIGGAGVYAWSAFTGGAASSDEPRVILADKEPIKVVPEEKGGKTVPNQDKAVYDRVAGDTASTPQQEQLVTSTEEPIDVVQRTLTPETLPFDGPEDDGEVADADDENRLLPGVDEPETAAAETGGKPVVSPRKVKTMIVKPDGTLVAREDIVAEPAAETASLDAKASATASGASGTAASAAVDTDISLREEQAAQEQQGSSALAKAAEAEVDDAAPVRTVKTTKIDASGSVDNTPVPGTRPADQPVNVVGTVTENGNVSSRQVAAASETKPAVEETQAAAVAPGGYVIQIASLPSEAEARKSYNTLSSKFSGVIGGRGVDIKQAEIPNKGTFFRVRIPAGSRDEANALCSRYKSAGGSCLVTR